MIALLGFAAGTVAAQASVSGRWHMRLSAGTGTLRGDLRLEQAGNSLRGTLVLESSDGPPVPLANGQVGPAGEVEFSVDAEESMRFSGRRTGSGLSGQVALDRGLVWRWSAERLPETAEFYAALPRFRASQLVIGRNLTELRLPGGWVSAAAGGPGVATAAAELVAAAGLSPIPADSARAYGFLPALGLSRREELVPATVRVLTAIRVALPQAMKPRFDALFRPRGTWLVDLHDAALDAARRRVRDASWEAARPALQAAGSMPVNQPPGTAILPLALYRLATMQQRDSAAYRATVDRLLLGGQPSAQVARALLDGYRDAASWQGQAVDFLLSAEWVTTPGGRTSPAGLVRAAWRRPDLPQPVIRPRYFGYPEALPRVGVPEAAVGKIVRAENWAGEQWALRRGPAAVLAVLRSLGIEIGLRTTLEAGGPWRLTSISREAAQTPAGFLETTDEIVEDPGIMPLFAVATAIHEWQHLLMESHRWSLPEGGALQPDSTGLRVVASDLFLAEGFAEWMSERILAPLLESTPLVGVGDAQKLVVLAADNPDDPHVLGPRLIRALAAATGDPAAARALVLAHGDAPSEIAAAVPAWQGSEVPDRVFPIRGERRLVPQTQFTIEDGVGDVTALWIRMAP